MLATSGRSCQLAPVDQSEYRHVGVADCASAATGLLRRDRQTDRHQTEACRPTLSAAHCQRNNSSIDLFPHLSIPVPVPLSSPHFPSFPCPSQCHLRLPSPFSLSRVLPFLVHVPLFPFQSAKYPKRHYSNKSSRERVKVWSAIKVGFSFRQHPVAPCSGRQVALKTTALIF